MIVSIAFIALDYFNFINEKHATILSSVFNVGIGFFIYKHMRLYTKIKTLLTSEYNEIMLNHNPVFMVKSNVFINTVQHNECTKITKLEEIKYKKMQVVDNFNNSVFCHTAKSFYTNENFYVFKDLKNYLQARTETLIINNKTKLLYVFMYSCLTTSLIQNNILFMLPMLLIPYWIYILIKGRKKQKIEYDMFNIYFKRLNQVDLNCQDGFFSVN
jgi:hypothetical protein